MNFSLKYGHVWEKDFLILCPSIEFSTTHISIMIGKKLREGKNRKGKKKKEEKLGGKQKGKKRKRGKLRRKGEGKKKKVLIARI